MIEDDEPPFWAKVSVSFLCVAALILAALIIVGCTTAPHGYQIPPQGPRTGVTVRWATDGYGWDNRFAADKHI